MELSFNLGELISVFLPAGLLIIAGFSFILLLLRLVINRRKDHGILNQMALYTAGLGAFLYMLGYMPRASFPQLLLSAPQAIARTLFSVARMFLGEDDFGNVVSLHPSLARLEGPLLSMPLFSEATPLYVSLYIILFWLAHAMAVFTSCALLLSTFGDMMIQRLRLFFKSRESMYILYSVTEKSLYFAENLLKQMAQHPKASPAVIFIEESVSESHRKRITQMGAMLYEKPIIEEGELVSSAIYAFGLSKKNKQWGNWDFLSRLQKETRQLRIYAFNNNEQANFTFTSKIMAYLSRNPFLKVEKGPSIRLFMQAGNPLYLDEIERLRKCEGQDKIDVTLFGEGELAAKNLLRQYPIYRTIRLEKGLATQPLGLLILGLGNVGLEVLREFIIQSPFIKSIDYKENDFHAVVVDKEASQVKSLVAMRYPALIPEYGISFIEADATGGDYLEAIKEQLADFRYIIITLGDDYRNILTGMELSELYDKLELPRPFILAHVRDPHDTRMSIPTGVLQFGNYKDIYREENLVDEEIYRRAVYFNALHTLIHSEFQDDVSKKDEMIARYREIIGDTSDAAAADYAQKRRSFNELSLFVQKSNLSCAGSLEAKLAVLDIEAGTVLSQAFSPDKWQQALFPYKERMYHAEHLRWNAFHYAHGWQGISLKELEERNEGRSVGRRHKFPDSKRHGCLTDWDNLAEVARIVSDAGEKENFNSKRFQFYDEMFVQCIPYILNAGLNATPGDLFPSRSNGGVSAVNHGREELACAVHEAWVKNMKENGWTYGSVRNDTLKISPLLIPYDQLPENEKQKDRVTVEAVLTQLGKKRNRPVNRL